MLKNYAGYFAELEVAFTLLLNRDYLSPDARATYRKPEFWRQCRETCKEIDLASSVVQIDRILDELDRHPEIDKTRLAWLIEGVRDRILEDLDKRYFLYLPVPKVQYWQKEDYFGKDVSRKIPEAREDIYEACSCFAVGRKAGHRDRQSTHGAGWWNVKRRVHTSMYRDQRNAG